MKMVIKMKMIFKMIISVFEKIIITPIGKAIYSVNKMFSGFTKLFENWLLMKSTLIFISLAISILVFIVIDQKLIVYTESSAEIISDLTIDVVYNEEAYVIEGIPEKVDLTLIGRRSELMFAKQASNHKVTIDLTGLLPGTHRVSIEYKQALPSITHSVNPSVATVVIYPKVSEIKPLSVDLLNQDVLSERLVISNLKVSADTVIVKGAEKDLNEVAVVKALVDLKNLASTDIGDVVLKGVPIVAYDSNGQIVQVEIEPERVDASMRVESPSKEVAIRVKPIGKVGFGKAISAIELSDTRVEIFGTEDVIEAINFIDLEIDVNNLAEDREFKVDLRAPLGVRALSISSVTVGISLGEAVEQEIKGINIEYRNLETGLAVQAVSQADVKVNVGLQGVASVLEGINIDDVRAFLDLAGLKAGEYEIDVQVEGTDVRVNYTPKTRKVNIKIVER